MASVNVESVVQGLFAVRAMVDSLIAQIAPEQPEFEAIGGGEAVPPVTTPTPPSAAKCRHKNVEDVAGMNSDDPKYVCVDCGQEVTRA